MDPVKNILGRNYNVCEECERPYTKKNPRYRGRFNMNVCCECINEYEREMSMHRPK